MYENVKELTNAKLKQKNEHLKEVMLYTVEDNNSLWWFRFEEIN